MSESTLPSENALDVSAAHREARRYLRFTVSDRAEHWTQMISFTILAITGLVQKYATSSLAEEIIRIMGGIESVRIIHRIAAVVLMLGVVYHLGSLGYKLFVQRVRPSILLSLSDARNAWETLLFNLGRRENRPQQGRYTFDEKVEYWAFVWGTMVMVITGFMMWNPIATTRYLPGEFIPAAKAAHGGEALLAVLAIIVWHIYHVHVRNFNKSMFSGYLTEEEMLEDHPIELADIKAGVASRPVDPQERRRRLGVFLPIYGTLALALLVGIYAFVTFEETAIKTLPPAEQVVIFVPLTPTPFPTPLPTRPPAASLAQSWEAGIGPLFQQKCGACHSGPAGLGGLDLSSYTSTLAGGNGGAAILPGNPAEGQLVIIQAAGNHPGQLSGEELALVREWIAAGAPER